MIGRDSAAGGGGLVGEAERGGAVGGGGRGSSDILHSPRRKSAAKAKVNPAAAPARQFASSNTAVNAAVNAFMGGNCKSWMTSSGDSDAPPAVNKQSSQKRPLRQNTTGLDQSALSRPSPLTSPGVDTASPQQTPIPSPGSGRPSAFSAPAATIHSVSDPVSHPPGPLSVGHSPVPQPMRRPDIRPPSNSTSPLLANTVSIRKDSGNSGISGNKQTLPSPTPSDDAAQEGRQGNRPIGAGYGGWDPRPGVSGAADSPHPGTQDSPPGQLNAEQPPNPMDTQSYPELGEKLDELKKRYGAENVNNYLRLSESARASPTEVTPGASSSHSSVPSKRPSDGPLERRDEESRPHSPVAQHAQPPNSSAADKRRRTQADPPSSLPSPGLSMANSPGLVQGQFQGQPHGQVQGHILSQASNQAPTQVPSQIPNPVLDQVPDQVRNRVPSQLSSRLPSQVLAQVNTSYVNGPPSAGLSPHGAQTPTQPPFVPSQQRRVSTAVVPPSLPNGYNLQEKRNQLICGTVPNRRPTAPQNPNRPALSKFLPIVDRELRLKMEQNTELPRMRLLREACQEEDWFYVALHQMYCLFTIQQQALAGMVGLSPKHLEGFQVVKELIKENQLLTKERLAWFAQFPSPLQDLYARSDLYRHAVSLVKDFLSVLPGAYGRFQNECRARRTPPLVHELVIVMKLQSLIFQRVVYIAIRRGMWGPTEDEYTRRMHEVFQENQREYLAILDRQDTAQPASITNIVHSHQRIALEYNNIRALQLEYYGVNSPNSFQSLLASQPSAPLQRAQNGPQEQNGQPIASTSTANVLPSHSPLVQSYNHTNTSQNTIAPRQLSVNTQAAQQHLPTGLPSTARIAHTSPAQTPSTGSPTTPGITAQLQHMQMQRRLRQQQENLDRALLQRRASQTGQRRQNTAPGQTNLQAVSTQHYATAAWEQGELESSHPVHQLPSTTPLPNGSGPGNGSLSGPGAGFLNRRQIVASVPAGAPEPRYTPTLGGFLPGGMSGSPRQHPGRSPHNRTRGSHARISLLPPSNSAPSTNPGLPNPTVTALHQAHLRSPYLKCATPPPMNEEAKLYQYVRDFPLQPTIFPQDRPLLSYHFDLPLSDSKRIANGESGTPESPPHDRRDLRRIRVVRPGSLMYRIRCVKLPSAELLSEDKWVTTESKWPDHVFIDVNQAKMETRRKLHFGKDLPIDITDYVGSGENHLKVSILRSQREINIHYAIAVEAIEVITHTEILKFAHENLIPTQQSLDAIKASLNAIPDDDDIAVVNNDLTINISDPFSARVFDIPARARSCLHRECFDLETFLMTRASKPKRASEPCMADEWKCPLCAGDARPHRLLIDVFLADVKRELNARGLGGTRAIVVDKEGSWVPKVEPGDDDVKREGSTASAATAAAAAGEKTATPAKGEVIIIDLDDD